MRIAVDNDCKDMAEVRDKETGVLLGFIPVNKKPYDGPYFKIPLRKRVSAVPSAVEAVKPVPISADFIELSWEPLFLGGHQIAAWTCSRVDWARLIKAERG